jgi:hypothetical protein
MGFGLLALLGALGLGGWLLWRMAKGAEDARNVTLLKGVAFLVLAAALFAVKLWPIAFMVLLAAGGVTAIEVWRDREIRAREGEGAGTPVPREAMRPDEAASILGVAPHADAETIRAAHRRLIGQLHPDKGGSDYLAAKINDARDVLLARADALSRPGPDGPQ